MSEAERGGSRVLADVMAGVSQAVARSLDSCGRDGLHHDNAICGLSDGIVAARGYGPASVYSYGGFEPLTLLAGLAFLAFLLQTLHALLYRGGHVGDRARRAHDPVPGIAQAVITALDKYEMAADREQQLGSAQEHQEQRGDQYVRSYWGGDPPGVDETCSRSLLCRLFPY